MMQAAVLYGAKDLRLEPRTRVVDVLPLSRVAEAMRLASKKETVLKVQLEIG